jgi:hypothetical protein
MGGHAPRRSAPCATLLFRGTVVDLITFANADFTNEIIETAVAVAELGHIRFIRPELLLVTQLLRPGARGVLAALELVVARRMLGGFDLGCASDWAARLMDRLERTLRQADALDEP